MAINVVCPGCHARFQVSDKFAGKKGPCPKCKAEITVPTKSEEIIIHGAEEFEGVKDSKGRSVLRPTSRTEVKVSPPVVVGIVGAAILVLVIAFLVRVSCEKKAPTVVLALGSVVLAPPLVLGGYTFLRDDELAPYRGVSLGIRVAICSVVYALLWGVFAVVVNVLSPGQVPQVWFLVFAVPPFMIAGATAGFASLDLDFGSGFFHYGLYLLVTALLRMVTGPPLWTV